MVDSCQECKSCKEGDEQFYTGPHDQTMTYNGYFKDPESDYNTFGGYSTEITAKEDFVLKILSGLDESKAAPILCAWLQPHILHLNTGALKNLVSMILGRSVWWCSSTDPLLFKASKSRDLFYWRFDRSKKSVFNLTTIGRKPENPI